MKLNKKELKLLMEDHTPKQIISMYCNLQIDLYKRDLVKLINSQYKKTKKRGVKTC